MTHIYTSEWKESVEILGYYVRKWKQEERKEWIEAKKYGTDRKEYIPKYKKEKL